MSAKLVKELRDRTGAGFLDCKKAIEATNGDISKAIIWLQEKGAAKAAKKAGAIAAEGIVKTVIEGNKVVIFELNSQTDFVAQNDKFQNLSNKIAKALLNSEFSNVEEANQILVDGKTIESLCVEATATIGEKILLRRAIKVVSNDVIGAYTHVNHRVAAIVITENGTSEVARNVAMHVASMNPLFLDEASVPEDKINEFKSQINDSPALKGKPDNIKENISKGMLRKKLSELTLVDQEFVMEKIVVSKYLSQNNAKAKAMYRFEVGEGVEKKQEDFAAEVEAQMKK